MRRLGFAAVAWGLMLFLYLPVIIVVVFSLQGSARLALPFVGPSLQWFRFILESDAFRSSLASSLKVGIASALTAMVLATLGGLGLTRSKFALQGPLSVLSMVPVAMPPLFLGIALLSYFSRIGLYPSLLTVYIAHVIYVLPYTLMVIRSRLDRFDASIEEAARDLGATWWQTFWKVTFPIMWPAVAAGGILAFALSFDEFLITVFVIGSDSTLPIMVWSRMRRTIDPSVNAAATALLAVLLTSFGGAALLLREQIRSAGRRRRAAAGDGASDGEEELGGSHAEVV